MFDEYSEVDAYWTKIRDIVVKNKLPRGLLVMPFLKVENDDVV